MCGIAGIISNNNKNSDLAKLEKMIYDINHRGPDDRAVWYDKEKCIYLAHARLSIIDLSKKGRQPMISDNGRYVITYNGEIYNHLELRKEIEKKNSITWNSNSDTETLLKLIEIYGVNKTLKKLRGMFAFSCYDKYKNLLFLCRDKFGEKPLYYGVIDNKFYFTSDLKSIILNNKNLELDYRAVNNFLMYSYVPSPQSILKNIYKLEAGFFMELNINNFLNGVKEFYNLVNWFDLDSEIYQSKKNEINGYKNCVNLIEDKLFKSVESQLIADVPVGCFLSGGIDSTLIAIALNKISKKKVETFSIGFENQSYDESNKSSKISSFLGLDNNLLKMQEEDMIDMVQNLPEIYSEPFADSSCLPSILLSKFSKSKVKVCLSGDGGDELFGGYTRYNLTDKIWSSLRIFPLEFRKFIKKILVDTTEEKKNLISNLFLMQYSEKNQKLEKFFDILDTKNKLNLYKEILTKSKDSFNLVKIDNSDKHFFNKFDKFSSFKENMMIHDIKHYMTDDILCKVDRSSMYHALETRVPFLDYELFSAAWQIPIKYKSNKIILKDIIGRHINYNEIAGPKKGFSIPLKKWLNLNMKSKVDEYVNLKKLNKYSFLKKDIIIELWEKFKNKKSINEHLIWNIFVLIQWLEKYKNNLKV